MRALVVLIALTAIARADDPVAAALAQIDALEQKLEYENASLLATRTIASGHATREQLVQLEMAAGRTAAGLDHADLAEQHFARALALAPSTTLPVGTSPKLTEPFDLARGGHPDLNAVIEWSATSVTVKVIADPLHMIAGLRVTLTDGRVLEGATRVSLPAPASSAEIVDEAKNQLLRDTPPVVVEKPIVRQPDEGTWHTPFALTALGIGVVGLGVGGVSAYKFADARDQWNTYSAAGGHSYTQLKTIEDRANRWALAADISFGVAAVSAVTFVVVLLTHESPAHVAVTGNGMAYFARF
ncbi:MAG: hypothetical protein QM831_01725 [Kofleriaceae bacterium]